MGGGQFYLYMYALCCVAVGALVGLGGILYVVGRRQERKRRGSRGAAGATGDNET